MLARNCVARAEVAWRHRRRAYTLMPSRALLQACRPRGLVQHRPVRRWHAEWFLPLRSTFL